MPRPGILLGRGGLYLIRYASMYLVLVVPEGVALIKVLWHTSFIKRTRTHQWPSGIAILAVRAMQIILSK